MTDFFALLEHPRQPWLDLEKLKEAFHEKSRTAHPDAGGSEAAFAQINEAYQSLLNPRRRLQHLLALEDKPPAAAGQVVASDIADLFQSVAATSQEADALVQKFAIASSPLSQSLLQAELRSIRERLAGLSATLQAGYDRADDELKELNASTDAPENRISELQRLAGRFAYLTRWLGELEERRAQLAQY